MKIAVVDFSEEWLVMATQVLAWREGIEMLSLDSVDEISQDIGFSLLLWNAKKFPEKGILWGMLVRQALQGSYEKVAHVFASGGRNVWGIPFSREELLQLLKDIKEEYGEK